jgi:3-dehydroquinate dehydratase/shikimate dehydrogenase
VVVSVRRRSDGGRFLGTEEQRGALLAAAGGAALVDVEVDADPALAPAGPGRIVSHHDLHGLPADLDELFQRCLLRGADVVKIAATPSSAEEAFRLLDLPLAGLGVGSYGGFTRVLAPFTYCASEPLAPGMPTPSELLDLYSVRRLGPAPALYGVAGDPIDHSESPALHNAALARDGLDAVYLKFRVDDLARFWPRFVEHGGAGLSVTAPLKVQAAELATSPDEEVVACGAANTLLADGRAFNTDYRAFLELVPPGPGSAVVMGAGGAARAAVPALRRVGYEVEVWARDPARAAVLGCDAAGSPEDAAVVVNTTPLEPPSGARFVVDLRYGPGVRAPERGVGGRAFLLAQARHQYRIFHGRELGPG